MPQPEISLTATPAPTARPRLQDARWRIHGFVCAASGCRMQVQGYGEGSFVWQVPPSSLWKITLTGPDGATAQQDAAADATGRLAFSLPAAATAGAMLTLGTPP